MPKVKVEIEMTDWYDNVNILWLTNDSFALSVMDADGLPLVGSGVDYTKVFYLLILLFKYTTS